jgi:TonB family protein
VHAVNIYCIHIIEINTDLLVLFTNFGKKMKKILSKIVITFGICGFAFLATAAQTKSSDATSLAQPLVAINHVVPEYPAKALTKKVEGFVTLSFGVNEEGEAVNIEVVDFEGSKYFIRSSVKALEKTRFNSTDGQQTLVNAQKTYDFYMVESDTNNGQMIAFNR